MSDIPRTEAGQKLSNYLRDAFVYEADDTEPIDVTDRILAIEREAYLLGIAELEHAEPVEVELVGDGTEISPLREGVMTYHYIDTDVECSCKPLRLTVAEDGSIRRISGGPLEGSIDISEPSQERR